MNRDSRTHQPAPSVSCGSGENAEVRGAFRRIVTQPRRLSLSLLCLLGVAGIGRAQSAQDARGKLCPAIWYQSEKCEPDETVKCVCDKCTRDDRCRCLVELKKGTGTVAGKLKSPFLRRRPAVVYIEKVANRTFAPPARNPVMDQKNLIFIPYLLPVLVDSIVDFPNSDTVRHNVFSAPKSAKPLNLGTYPAGEVKQVTFDKDGVVPLLCNMHAEMSAYVVVLQNPHFALTDKEGAATLRNVPEGEYTLTFWHEDLKSVSKPIKVTQQQITEVQFENLSRK